VRPAEERETERKRVRMRMRVLQESRRRGWIRMGSIDSRLFELAWPGRSARLPAFGSVSYQRTTLTCRGHAMLR
jgi:hypothetical protein